MLEIRKEKAVLKVYEKGICGINLLDFRRFNKEWIRNNPEAEEAKNELLKYLKENKEIKNRNEKIEILQNGKKEKIDIEKAVKTILKKDEVFIGRNEDVVYLTDSQMMIKASFKSFEEISRHNQELEEALKKLEETGMNNLRMKPVMNEISYDLEKVFSSLQKKFTYETKEDFTHKLPIKKYKRYLLENKKYDYTQYVKQEYIDALKNKEYFLNDCLYQETESYSVVIMPRRERVAA